MTVTRRLSIAAAAVALAATVLSSCGFNKPTTMIYTPSVGVSDRTGSVDVLGALIVSGADGSGTVVAALVNNDLDKADKLVGIAGSGRDQGLTVKVRGTIDIPATGAYQLADKGEATARGERIAPGKFVTLTFSFQHGEVVTIDVPVVAHANDYADVPVP